MGCRSSPACATIRSSSTSCSSSTSSPAKRRRSATPASTRSPGPTCSPSSSSCQARSSATRSSAFGARPAGHSSNTDLKERLTMTRIAKLAALAVVGALLGCQSPYAPRDIAMSVLLNKTLQQEDRFGLPAIATVFIPTTLKDAYNLGSPSGDVANFKSLIVAKLMAFGQDAASANALASALAPDVQPIDLSQPSNFLNGRKPSDDVITADVRRAESLARSVLPLVSDTGGAYARLGAVYLTQHKFAAAYDASRRAVNWNPRNQGALGVLFDAAVATGRYAVAESALTRLTPGRLPYQFRAAHMLAMQGRMDGAYHALDHACVQLASAAARPQALAWCLTELAKIQLVRAGEGEPAAAALYQQALQVQPGYRAGIEGLADLAFARGDWRKARELFGRIAVDAHPDLYLRLAEVHRA